MSDYLVQQIAEMRQEIAELKNGRVTHRAAQVTASDPVTGSFSATLPTGETLSGLSSPPQFTPDPGQWVRLRLDGSTPIYEAAGIGENAITTRELSDGAVGLQQLAFDINDYTGGTTVFYGASTPSATAVGDLWLKELAAGPPPEYETRRWSGTTWVLLADQAATDAILAAEAAQAAADSKAQLFTQPSAPTGLGPGDKAIWQDTDDGNRTYVWANSGTVERRNLATNPSFEYDPAGTLSGTTSASGGYTRFSSGSPGTLTHSIEATGGTQGSKYYKVVGASMAPTAEMGVILTRPISPGDIAKVSADMWVTVASTTKPVQMYVDVVNGSNTVLASTRVTGTGSTGAQRLTASPLTAPAGAVSIRVWLMRVSSSTGANGTPVSSVTTTNADVNIDGVLIDLNAAATAPTTYFDGASGGEARWDGTPHLSTSTVWQAGSVGAMGWQPRLLRTGAFQPGSIVASTVIATGTISAPLLEALMVLTNVVIAGTPNGEHARLDGSGLSAYAADPGDGGLVELSRFGRGLSVRNSSTGLVTGSINELGQAAFQSLTVRESDPSFGGVKLSELLWNTAWGIVGHAEYPVVATGDNFSGRATGEIPVWEVAYTAVPGRAYRLMSTPIELAADVGTKAFLRTRMTVDGTAPTTNSPIYTEQLVAGLDSGWGPGQVMNFLAWGPPRAAPGDTPAASVLRRILVTIAPPTGGDIKMWRKYLEYFWVEDIGPLPTERGQVAGGATAKQQITTDWAASWSRSWRADGTTISYDDPLYQGLKETGDVLGRQVSAVGFPNVTTTLSGATIEKVLIYLYAEHWANATGGVANLQYHAATTEPASAPGGISIGTIAYSARGQGIWIDLTKWKTQIQNGTFRGLKLVAPDDLPINYGRFTGANGAIENPKLKIVYTK